MQYMFCRMLQGEYSAIPSTFIVVKIFVLFIFEWPFYTGFTGHLHMEELSFLISNSIVLVNCDVIGIDAKIMV